MEEKIQELLRIAKQNGTQATTVLLEIEQLLNGDNDEVQELLRIAKQNGTQATTVLLEIEQLLNGDDEELQELLEKAKQNGTQATTVLTEIAEINSSKPIPVEGDVQIFANPECTEYATGEVSKVYARVNKPWNFGGGWSAGSMFIATAPDRENPTDNYSIQCFIDFTSKSYNKPFEVGQVVECLLYGQEGIVDVIDVTDFDKIFSNPAKPVEGDVQIFADPECTKYANELTEPTDTLYVRINKPWVGLNSGWAVGGNVTANSFNASAPNSEYPSDPYSISVYIDFGAGNDDKPFSAGEVVKVTGSGEYNIDSGYSVIFSKP